MADNTNKFLCLEEKWIHQNLTDVNQFAALLTRQVQALGFKLLEPIIPSCITIEERNPRNYYGFEGKEVTIVRFEWQINNPRVAKSDRFWKEHEEACEFLRSQRNDQTWWSWNHRLPNKRVTWRRSVERLYGLMHAFSNQLWKGMTFSQIWSEKDESGSVPIKFEIVASSLDDERFVGLKDLVLGFHSYKKEKKLIQEKISESSTEYRNNRRPFIRIADPTYQILRMECEELTKKLDEVRKKLALRDEFLFDEDADYRDGLVKSFEQGIPRELKDTAKRLSEQGFNVPNNVDHSIFTYNFGR